MTNPNLYKYSKENDQERQTNAKVKWNGKNDHHDPTWLVHPWMEWPKHSIALTQHTIFTWLLSEKEADKNANFKDVIQKQSQRQAKVKNLGNIMSYDTNPSHRTITYSKTSKTKKQTKGGYGLANMLPRAILYKWHIETKVPKYVWLKLNKQVTLFWYDFEFMVAMFGGCCELWGTCDGWLL